MTPETLAEMCLGYLAGDPELLGEFMGVTGYSPDGLREAVRTEAFGRGLIDYFAQNEQLLRALCGANGVEPADFMRVWAKLNPAG
jgi:hypothetical protein